jgi:hypothetical protein
MEVTRKGWSERKDISAMSGNSEYLSSGCESRPAKAKTRRPVASLATAWVTTTAIRRRARARAVGMQSRNLIVPVAQNFMALEGSSTIHANEVEWVVQPAGCSTMARAQEDGPVIWEALSVLHESDSSAGRSERGEPELGCDAMQGVGGLNRSDDLGERQAPGPERAKAARADVNFRRAT